MSIYAVLTPTTACRALREAGFPHPAEALHIDAREERWAVSLPDGHIAWFPASEAGATRLAVGVGQLNGSQRYRLAGRVDPIERSSPRFFRFCHPKSRQKPRFSAAQGPLTPSENDPVRDPRPRRVIQRKAKQTAAFRALRPG